VFQGYGTQQADGSYVMNKRGSTAIYRPFSVSGPGMVYVSQSNRGVSNADIANITHGYITGAAAESARRVYEQGFKYGQRINGKVVTSKQLANYADDIAKGTKF
ncbi:MAG: hypothetical protein JXR57_05845, partial [Bacteroidales bacterium]|nr:hypothetical protein [Bacteroidales bacterium]